MGLITLLTTLYNLCFARKNIKKVMKNNLQGDKDQMIFLFVVIPLKNNPEMKNKFLQFVTKSVHNALKPSRVKTL